MEIRYGDGRYCAIDNRLLLLLRNEFSSYMNSGIGGDKTNTLSAFDVLCNGTMW